MSPPEYKQCSCLGGTYEHLVRLQALEYATTGAADTTTREAVLMYVYLQLCQGETDSALAQLRSMQLGATA